MESDSASFTSSGVSQLQLRSQADGCAAGEADTLLVESFPGGFLDGFHDQEEISVERALDHLARLAGAVGRLIVADGADVAADGVDVWPDVVALHRLDGAGDLREQPEERAGRRLLEVASAIDGAFGAELADSVSDNRL